MGLKKDNNRKEAKTNAMRLLDKHQISYKIHTYERNGFLDGISVAKKLLLPFERTFKTLVLRGKGGGYFVFVIPVDKELDLKKAAKATGEKSVEMIPVRDITPVTGYIRGGVSPVGMKKQYPCIVHMTAMDFESIVFSGGRIGTQIEMSPGDLKHVISCEFADIIKA